MDAYEESSGVYVDSIGHPLTYFAWGNNEPTSPMNERFVAMLSYHNLKWADVGAAHSQNVVCVKCHPGYYTGPQTFFLKF